MAVQQVFDEALPMLDDILGRIGIHQSGMPLNFASLRIPFSSWLQQQTVAQEDFPFMVSLVGAFICEYLIQQCGAQRYLAGPRIFLRMPLQATVAREFDPYVTAAGLVNQRGGLSEFLVVVGT